MPRPDERAEPLATAPVTIPTMVSLRIPTLADAEPLTAAVRESLDDLAPWMDWARPGYDVEEAWTWIGVQAAHRERRTGFEFLIVDGDGGILGACGINRISEPPYRYANLGYWVRSSASGRGVAPEAARLLAEWAWASTDLVRLEIVVAVGNERSLKVALKVGARWEGVLRSRLWTGGVAQDAVMHSLIRPEGR